MEDLNSQESEKKMELSIKYQADCKKIQAQIGQLKKKAEGAAEELPERQSMVA